MLYRIAGCNLEEEVLRVGLLVVVLAETQREWVTYHKLAYYTSPRHKETMLLIQVLFLRSFLRDEHQKKETPR